MKQLPYTWFDHRTDLPRWITSQVGQIAAEWSVLEREMEQLIHLLTDTDIGIARIVTNRMNAPNRIATIKHLIEWYVYHGQLKPDVLKRFVKLGQNIEEKTQVQRDKLAHGLWSKIGGRWHVLRLRGYRPVPELEPDLKKLSRPLLPQKESITREGPKAIIDQVIADAKALEGLCGELYDTLSPSLLRYAPPKYSRRRHRGRK
jgi:hypothetical protein